MGSKERKIIMYQLLIFKRCVLIILIVFEVEESNLNYILEGFKVLEVTFFMVWWALRTNEQRVANKRED